MKSFGQFIVEQVKKSQQKQFILNKDEFSRFVNYPGRRMATIHDTLGPHYKHIYWDHINRPHVVPDVDPKKVLSNINAEIRIKK